MKVRFNDIITSIFNQRLVQLTTLCLVADTKLRRVISDFARVSAGATTDNIRSVNYDGGCWSNQTYC